MSESQIEAIRKNIEDKDNEELYDIWDQRNWNDEYRVWSGEACEAAKQILLSRGESASNFIEEGTHKEDHAEPTKKVKHPWYRILAMVLLALSVLSYSMRQFYNPEGSVVVALILSLYGGFPSLMLLVRSYGSKLTILKVIGIVIGGFSTWIYIANFLLHGSLEDVEIGALIFSIIILFLGMKRSKY